MRDAFIDCLVELAEVRDDVFLITGDLGFGVLDEYAERFPGQYLNVGVAEQNMTGVAAGLALEGFRVFTYSIANFTTLRCLEQIRNDVCYHDASVTVVSVGGGFGYGALGMSHHATEDLSIMRAMPQIKIMVPGDDYETVESTKYLAEQTGPSYLRLERGSVKLAAVEESNFNYGKARLLRPGSSLTVFCSGGLTEIAVEVADKLLKLDITLRVHSVSALKVMDVQAIRDAAEQTHGIITLEENTLLGGLGSAIAEVCMDEGIAPKTFKRLGLGDTFSSVVGSQDYLRHFYGIGAASLEKTVTTILGGVK